jgi:large subunit ribosomal protein L25
MKTFELKGSVRADLGKKASKAERVSENVPCVLYGGANNVHFTATASDLRKLIYSPDVFVEQLDIDRQKCNSIMKALQFHPVTDKVLHIDFLQVTEDKPVVVEIPVKLEGLAEGVKAGGKLALEMRKLKVKGLYNQIPERIVIDVTSLGLGKSNANLPPAFTPSANPSSLTGISTTTGLSSVTCKKSICKTLSVTGWN